MASEHALRDDLIARVEAGTMTPSAAESEAARLGLQAIEFRPDRDGFDPMQERFWTLPMAVAWIAYRTADVVREHWHAYRSKCRHWVYFSQLNMPGRSGLALCNFEDTSLRRMQEAEKLEQNGHDCTLSVAQAKQALWQALSNSEVHASGIELATGKRELIDALRLQDLTLGEADHHDALCVRASIGIGPVRYTNITVPMAEVCHHWRQDRIGPDAPDQASLRSGAPGRPTSMHLVEGEFRHRCEKGLVKERISDEAKFLSSWLKAAHPQAHPTTAKTIGNRLGPAFRAYWSARK